MDSGGQSEVQSEVEGGVVSEEIGGTKTFNATLGDHDPMKRAGVPRPDHVPEKFWDAETGAVRYDDLMKSYSELEKLVGKPKEQTEEKPEGATEEQPAAETEEQPAAETEEKPEGETEEKPEGETEEQPEATPALKDAVENAQKVYAETGDLTEEARQPLIEAGITNEQIDYYIQGVKAKEQALRVAATQAAEVDDFSQVEEAIAWAASNWSPKKINSFNEASGDVETVGLAVSGLFKEYRAANPSEGRLANVNSGVNRGDVYTNREQFAKDLAAADKAGDRVARREAVEKMNRSQRIGSLRK